MIVSIYAFPSCHAFNAVYQELFVNQNYPGAYYVVEQLSNSIRLPTLIQFYVEVNI